MPDLLLEIGCEELPASACREALRQLPELVEKHLGTPPTSVWVGPRRLAIVVEGVPAEPPRRWIKGPPATAPDQAKEGFARRHGLAPAALEERDGFLGVEVAGASLADRLAELVGGVTFGKSMRWTREGIRFARPVRWLLAKLDSETITFEVDGLVSDTFTFGHRFTHGQLEILDTGAYLGYLRNAGVEPDHVERRRQIVEGLDALGSWSDPMGKIEEVLHLVERPTVIEGAFAERFLALPERVVQTAMQSHQRYFPLGGNRFAFVANGGDPDVVRAGNRTILEGRLDDAAFTFERDVQKGIEGLYSELGRITFFAGAGSFADKTDRLVLKVQELGGDATAVEAARLAKADQAAELVREFPDLQGYIGAHYARLADISDDVAVAIEEHYLPDGADAPIPSTPAGRLVSAADKLDTLEVSFGLGQRPTGSRDPYGLRRAAIGLCRLAVEGGVEIRLDGLSVDVRDFVEERLESLLDVPVEFVRAARAGSAEDLGSLAGLATDLAALPPDELAAIHQVYSRAQRITTGMELGQWDDELLSDEAELALAAGLRAAQPALAGNDRPSAFTAAVQLAPIVARFFDEVLVMTDDERVRENRLKLLAQLRRDIGRLGDFSLLQL